MWPKRDCFADDAGDDDDDDEQRGEIALIFV
jgi:hypothetical protein